MPAWSASLGWEDLGERQLPNQAEVFGVGIELTLELL